MRAVEDVKRKKLAILPLERRLMLDASLPAIAGQVLWLDAADASTIIDADGDDAATGTGGSNDGFSGSVATWRDKSASGFDVSAIAGEQPLYGVDTQNGQDVITFDGGNDRLTSGDAVPGDDVTMFVVYNRMASTGRDAVFELGSGGSRNGVFLFANNTIQHYSSGTFRTLGGTYTLGDYHLASFIHDTTNIDAWMNGTNVLSTTTTARASTTSITVGDDVTSSDEMTGTVAEVLVYDRDLSADERHDVETYLAGKWGLTITNVDPTLDTNAGITVDEAATLAITNAELASSDADNSDGNLRYTITDAVDNGTLTNTNTAQTLGLGDSFTQSDIDNGFITYTHNGNSAISDSFIFNMSDGLGAVNNQTFNITITPTGTPGDIASISNPVLHFDATDIDADGDTSDQPADGSTVSQWRDGAAPSNHATASGSTQPVYDDDAFGPGKGGIVYDGSNDELDLPTTTEVNNTTFTEKSFAFTFRTGTDIVSDQLVYEQGGGTHGFNFGIFGGNFYAHQYRNSATISYAVDLGAMQANTTYQVIAIFDSGTNSWSANINGGAFTNIVTAGTMPGHSGAPGLGNENGDTRDPVTKGSVSGLDFAGAIGEFWSWNHALTAGEIADVQDYLNDKWFDTAHTLTTNAALDVVTDSIISITPANLETDDLESADTAITYTLTALPAQGTLYLSGIALGMSDTFTQDDVNNSLLTFDHDGTPAPGADSFDFTVSDGFHSATAGTFSFNIINAAGNDPVLITNNLVTLNEGATATITVADLDTNDGDTPDTNLTYTVTSDVTNGTLFNNGVAMGLNDTFTQDDIVNNLITYTHDDSELFTDSFNFTVSDGTTSLGPTAFSFTITPVNDQTPADIALSSTSVNENVGIGTVVGNLSGTDADLPGDTFTFSIAADPDSKFQIVGSQLRTNGSLNREASASHNVTIRISDGVHTYDEAFVITVNDLNENPTDLTLSNTTIAENSSVGTVIGTLGATDPDLPGDSFTYTITSDPDGVFQIVGNQLRVGANMDFETANSHNVSIRVSDGNGGTRTEAYVINVTDVNDVPVVSFGTAAIVGHGGERVLTTAMLTATDVDNADPGLIYEISGLPGKGDVKLNGVVLGIGDTFTQQDLIDGNVTYDHDNPAAGNSDSFDFTVTDGGLTTAVQTLTIQVNPARVNLNDVTLAEGGTALVDNTDLNFAGQDSSWYDSNWGFRQKITIDSAMVSADLTDFALLITENGFAADFWANVKADGSDIVVTMADGTTVLDRELVSIDTGGQTMQLYTRTDLSSTADTELYIYYGNAAAAETNDTTTWRNEYVGVWHFDDDFNDGDAADSSQAGNHGFAGGGFDNTNQAAGVTGGGAEFNDSEYLALNYSYSGNNTLPQVSVSAWINTSVNSGGQTDNWAVIDFDRSEFFDVFIHGDGTVGFSTSGNGLSTNDQVSTGVTVNDGTWHHIAAVYDGSDKILYVDGAEVARSTNTYGGAALGKGTRFGFIGDGSEAGSFNSSRNNVYYDGLYDDIRLYEGTMGGAWIAAEFANHDDPSTFYGTGAQEVENGVVNYTITDLPDNGTLFLDTLTANGMLDAGEELTLGGTFSQTDIDANLLFYSHDGGETLADSFDFTASDLLANVTATQTFDFVITPVNDFPTALNLDNLSVNENVSPGTVVGLLSTADVDLPGDSFTYTIVDDPDAKFQISGNRLLVLGSLDFEAATEHTLTLRTDDGNGGTFDQLFTVTVQDINDDPVFAVPPDNDRDSDSSSDGENSSNPDRPNAGPAGGSEERSLQTTLKALEQSKKSSAILRATLSGDAQQFSAFYSLSNFTQILREKTTVALDEILQNDRQQQETAPGVPAEQSPADIPEPDFRTQETQIQDRFTNLREALAFFEQLDGEGYERESHDHQMDQSDNGYSMQLLPKSTLDRQFHDVLTYHQKRQNDLRKALLDQNSAS